MTKDEIVIQGLSTGRDAELEVRERGGGGAVFSLQDIERGSWLGEYKTTGQGGRGVSLRGAISSNQPMQFLKLGTYVLIHLGSSSKSAATLSTTRHPMHSS